MTDFPLTRIEETAIHHRKSAGKVVQHERAVWSKARDAMEGLQLQGADLDAQIEELAKSDGFRRQYATNMLTEILDAAIKGTGANMGNIQLYDPKARRLLIHVQKGFRR